MSFASLVSNLASAGQQIAMKTGAALGTQAPVVPQISREEAVDRLRQVRATPLSPDQFIAARPRLPRRVDMQQVASTTVDIFTGSTLPPLFAAGKDALELVTNDRVWGESIGVDRGKTPRHFGYGEPAATLGELKIGPMWEVEGTDVWNVTTKDTHEIAAKVRTFGEVELDTLSAVIGVETEIGYRGTSKATSANGADRGQVDAFAGLRGRLFAEQGPLGGSIGSEAFFGLSFEQTQDSRPTQGDAGRWRTGSASYDLGLSGAGILDVDALGAEMYVGLRAGLDLRARTRDFEPIGAGFGLLHKGDAQLFAGATTNYYLKAGPTGISAEADAFAGVRASYQRGMSLAYEGTQLVGGYLSVEGRLGIGVSGSADFGIDWDEQRIGASAKGGFALGVGLGGGGGISLGSKEFGGLVGLG